MSGPTICANCDAKLVAGPLCIRCGYWNPGSKNPISVAAGRPEIERPTLGQCHVLRAQDIIAGGPEIEEANCGSI